jgi:hypothetical protein
MTVITCSSLSHLKDWFHLILSLICYPLFYQEKNRSVKEIRQEKLLHSLMLYCMRGCFRVLGKSEQFISLSYHFHFTFISLSFHFHFTFISLSFHFHLIFISLSFHFHFSSFHFISLSHSFHFHFHFHLTFTSVHFTFSAASLPQYLSNISTIASPRISYEDIF